MLASHLSVFVAEDDTPTYDMVAWDDPATTGPLPHAELALHRHHRQSHRLTDRFAPHGSRGGARLDTLDGRCALWRLTAGPRRGNRRRQALLEAAILARTVFADAAAAR